ncbi:ankyrin repeat domain-containing protein [Legionella clemsonensis]|uniref:Phosphocholine transferase AnkX n=1 Tax=Legionella clemsonensis TaxID=1867846 RepID=A0A222P254_9GAMM|nr:ankyrin repeat domain-containing protein [Legionella clemsonensis]ASQ45932.1 Phosphocholine transferase AnkX [Legionella clemsonensis]
MSDLFYWREVFGEASLLSTFEREIKQLLEGDYKSLKLEKLHGISGVSIYSIRVNRETRLLFAPYNERLYLLDPVYKHEYAKNRYLRNPSLLKTLFSKLDTSIDIPLEKLTLEACSPAENEALEKQLSSSKEKSRLIALDYYKENFIRLSTPQEQALQAKLPALVYGPAGSGKTCVAFLALADYLKRMNQQESRPILYVSRSALLVAQMKAQWESNAEEKRRDSVVFLTYEELFKKHCAEKGKPLADISLFNDWLTKTLKQAQFKTLAGSLTAEEIWREFRIRSGYTPEDYIQLGTRQSSVNEEQRQLICQLYTTFLAAYLTSELTPIATAKSYPMVLVDEAQDLSFAQLYSLYQLADENNIAYFLGDHQILFDGKSRLPFLRQLFHKAQQPFSEYQLAASYRCSRLVVKVTNALIQLKYQATGGAADKVELGQITSAKEDNDRGELLWLDTNSEELKALQQEALSNARFAVVAFPEFIKEARETFKTPLVFTPEQIKGLEYDTILFWRPLDGKDSAAACAKLKEKKGTVNTTSHLPKAGEGDDSCLPYFNGFITGVTRAERRVVFAQNKTHRNEPLYHALNPAFINENQQATPPQNTPIPQSTTQDWENEARKLVLQGNETQACNIFQNKLGRTQEEFRAFQKLIMNALPAAEITKKERTNSEENKMQEENSFTETEKNVQEEQFQIHKKKKKVKSLSPLQQLMNNFSEKQLTATLSTYPFEEILLQATAIPDQVPRKSQTLLEFALSNRNRTQLFLKVIINDHQLTANFIRTYLQISEFYNKSYSPKWSGKKLFLQFCQLVNKVSEFTIVSNLYLVHFAAALGDIDYINFLHKLGADFDKPDANSVTPIFVAAKNGHAYAVAKLYELGADPNRARIGGATPAFVAAQMGYNEVIKILAQCRANLNQENSLGSTPAIAAAEIGRVDTLETLFKCDADLNKPNKRGATPVFIAAQSGHVDAVAKLHECGADLDKSNTNGATPIFIAAQNGYANVVAKLHECGANPDKARIDGVTPVYIAAYGGHANTVATLHQCGADLDKGESNGETPAFIAAQMGHANVLEVLAQCGALLNKEKNNGATPACVAAEKGLVNVLLKLCEYNANFNKAMFNGTTPAIIAAQNGHVDVFESLYKGGADFNKADVKGVTPAFVAAYLGHTTILKKLNEYGVDLNKAKADGITPAYIAAETGRIEVLETLFKCGVDLNKPDNNGITPAIVAAKKGHANVIAKLREYGIDFNKATPDGVTPILIATQKGHAKVIEQLCLGGVNPDMPDAKGSTPAHLAAACGHASAIEMLFKCGASLNKPNPKGLTPVILATQNGHAAIIKTLHQCGADLDQADSKGVTPVFTAAQCGHIDVIKTLYDCGINLESLNKNQETLIHVAIKNKKLNVLITLYELNSNWEKALNDITPAHIAIQQGNIDFIKSMLEKNIKFNVPYMANKNELKKLIEGYTKKNNSTQKVVWAKMEQFVERQGNVEDRLSISPLDLAEIINRQDIVDLLRSYETPCQHPYSFFNSKKLLEGSKHPLELKL